MANPQDRADFSTWFVADRSHVESDCVLTDVCCAHAHYTVWRDTLLILLSFSLLVNGHQYMNHHFSLSSRQRQLLDSFFWRSSKSATLLTRCGHICWSGIRRSFVMLAQEPCVRRGYG